MSSTPRSIRVSAPGKVLLTGGYLILEEQYSGLVLATSAEFHSSIIAEKRPSIDQFVPTNAVLAVEVDSPQYKQSISGWIIKNGVLFELKLRDNSDRNAYIEETLVCAINGIAGLKPTEFHQLTQSLMCHHNQLHIRLEADNAFYSQAKRLRDSGKTLCRLSLQSLMPYLPPVQKVHADGTTSIAKTGLGSSATLVTSLVGALVRFFLPTLADPMVIIHNLAQLSHCFVQRKIGSGFDVSAACFGSHRYTRFSPAILDEFTSLETLDPVRIAHCINDPLNKWHTADRITPFNLPEPFHMLMGDVSTGTTTVSMVRKVLEWKKSKPVDAQCMIQLLASRNAAVEQAFAQLNVVVDSKKEMFSSTCAELAQVPATEWMMLNSTFGSLLINIRKAFQLVRESFREMGLCANVPIEPTEQTKLLDATMEIPGVLIAGVPGAGGYDAVFVLVIHPSALDRVEALWMSWSQTHPGFAICPILCDISHKAPTI